MDASWRGSSFWSGSEQSDLSEGGSDFSDEELPQVVTETNESKDPRIDSRYPDNYADLAVAVETAMQLTRALVSAPHPRWSRIHAQSELTVYAAVFMTPSILPCILHHLCCCDIC